MSSGGDTTSIAPQGGGNDLVFAKSNGAGLGTLNLASGPASISTMAAHTTVDADVAVTASAGLTISVDG